MFHEWRKRRAERRLLLRLQKELRTETVRCVYCDKEAAWGDLELCCSCGAWLCTECPSRNNWRCCGAALENKREAEIELAAILALEEVEK